MFQLTDLEEMIPPPQHLAIAAVRGQVSRLDLRSEAIDEVPSSLRSAAEDSQILPAKWNGAGPGAGLSRHDPSPVFGQGDASTELSHSVPTHHGTTEHGCSRAPRRQVYRLGSSNRTTNQEQPQRLQEVGFPLGIGAA